MTRRQNMCNESEYINTTYKVYCGSLRAVCSAQCSQRPPQEGSLGMGGNLEAVASTAAPPPSR
jgi:hypothetical protein